MTPDRGGGVHRKDFTPQKTTAAFRNASCRPVDLFLSGKLREAENGVSGTGKEAAAPKAELDAEIRAGEDVATLQSPLPSSEDLPTPSSTPSMKARPVRPVPAQERADRSAERGAPGHADGEQDTGMGSGGAAEAKNAASLVAASEDVRKNSLRCSPPTPAVAFTRRAFCAPACDSHPDPAAALFAAPSTAGGVRWGDFGDAEEAG